MKSGHPVQLLLTPVAVVLNYAQPLGYESVFMTGVSGGGWTTTVYAALDPRITRSYPAAGTLPLHLREDRNRTNSAQRPADWGDYEQTIPELHSIANYLDLYILSSLGGQRKQLQIVNLYDSSCFNGEAFRAFEDVVNERVRNLGGGSFEVFLDTNNRTHSISRDAMNVILQDINSSF
jgi:pimeloyl-ACP methyl ester carboxylesterase